jgi:small GTP-binding protein
MGISGNESRRVLAVFAHVDAGKTTLTEQLLHLGGVVRRPGSIEGGNTVTDWREDEQARGITISTAAASFSFAGVTFDLLDTPGHLDFAVEVSWALDEIDGAILVVSAPDGVQGRTLALWSALRLRGIPTVVFVNKVDTGHVHLPTVLRGLSASLQAPMFPVNWPDIHEDADSFTWFGAWDLLTGHWHDADGPSPWVGPGDGAGPTESASTAAEARDALRDALLERDDSLLSLWLEGGTPTTPALRAALNEATRSGALFPVVLGSAALGHAVDTLAAVAAACLPPPAPLPALSDAGLLRVLKRDLLPPDPRASERGVLVVARHVAGDLPLAPTLFPVGSAAAIHPVALGVVLGRELLPAEDAAPGGLLGFQVPLSLAAALSPGTVLATLPFDSVADAGLPATSLQRRGFGEVGRGAGEAAHPDLPPAAVWIGLDAADPEVHAHLVALLHAYRLIDPSLQLRSDPASGQLHLGGPGELHLDVVLGRLTRELRATGDGAAAPDDITGLLRRGPMRVRRSRSLSHAVRGEAEVHDANTKACHTLHVTIRPAPVRPDGSDDDRDRGPGFRPQADTPQTAALSAGIDFALQLPLRDDEDLAPVVVTVTSPGRAEDLHRLPPPVCRELGARAVQEALRAAPWSLHEPWVDVVALVPWPAIGRFQTELARRGVPPLSPGDAHAVGQIFEGSSRLAPLLGFPTSFAEFTAGFGWVSLTAHRDGPASPAAESSISTETA